jgi:phosphatidylserine/phosphatidylglycerophosphate/cardiolipin synthase-like enzyme
MQALLDHLSASLEDNVLSTAEKRSLAALLREQPLRGDQLRQLRNHAFSLVRERARDPGHGESMVALIGWLERVIKTLDQVQMQVAIRSEVWFSPGDECFNAIVSHLRGCRQQLDICVFTIADDRITAAILEAHERQVAVRIISDNDKREDQGSDIDRMRQAGVPIALDQSCAHMHHKFAIFDNRRVLNGSFNWTRSASRYNEENLVSTTDPNQVRHFQTQFEELWQRFA